MDRRVQLAIRRITRANKGVLLAMGALLIASLNATKAMQDLQEVLENVTVSEEDPEAKAKKVHKIMSNIVEEYAEGVN